MEAQEPAKRFRHLKISEKAKNVAWNAEGPRSCIITARVGRDKSTINRVVINAIPQDYCLKLSNSMPSRIQQVLAVKEAVLRIQICMDLHKNCRLDQDPDPHKKYMYGSGS
jgi:hypothetical protein